ncbi:MAG TPA: hypothetical protein EYN33_05975 [Gammaproteobacteria bacterium]|nr:hypothetical protein [Gammaproteobacteria bacterium]
MGKMQRTKGQVGEREFAKLIFTNLGIECNRRIEQTRDSGHDLDLMDYAIEVKRAKKMNVTSWWRQTVENALAVNKVPVLAYRIDNLKWHVVMSFRHTLNSFGDCSIQDVEKTITFRADGWFDYVKTRL